MLIKSRTKVYLKYIKSIQTYIYYTFDLLMIYCKYAAVFKGDPTQSIMRERRGEGMQSGFGGQKKPGGLTPGRDERISLLQLLQEQHFAGLGKIAGGHSVNIHSAADLIIFIVPAVPLDFMFAFIQDTSVQSADLLSFEVIDIQKHFFLGIYCKGDLSRRMEGVGVVLVQGERQIDHDLALVTDISIRRSSGHFDRQSVLQGSCGDRIDIGKGIKQTVVLQVILDADGAVVAGHGRIADGMILENEDSVSSGSGNKNQLQGGRAYGRWP